MAVTRGLKRFDNQFAINKDLAAEIAGVSSQTLILWMKDGTQTPPPRNPDGTFPAREFGEWVRMHQTLRTVYGKHKYMPPGVAFIEKPSVKVKIPTGGGMPIPEEPQVGAALKINFNVEKARSERARAIKLETENDMLSGRLIEAETVEHHWSEILSRVRTRILKIPFAAAPVILGSDTVVQIQEIITGFVRDALAELSTDWREDGTEEADDEGRDTV
jgi:hypothetical protein